MIFVKKVLFKKKGVIRETGSVGSALLIWIACGVYSVFGAISYAELGCMIPKTGGEYEYFKVAFGDIFGFLFVWTMTIIYNPASTAIAALTFADYTLQWFFPTCGIPLASRMALAAAAISKFVYTLRFSADSSILK
jgi:L-type amino acid transporter 8